MQLRVAESSDVGFLADVVISATRDQGRLADDFDEAGFRAGFESWTADQIGGRVADSTTYVIEVDGERAGRLRVVRAANVLELAGIQLLPPFQSRGVGSEILMLLKAEAASTGAPFELAVDIDNPRAQALYERHGLIVVASTDNEYRLRWTSRRRCAEPPAASADQRRRSRPDDLIPAAIGYSPQRQPGIDQADAM